MRRPAALLMALLGGCLAPDPLLECDHHASGSAETLWCGAHRDAILRFVRLPADDDGRRSRLEWVRSTFYPAAAKASSEETVAILVSTLEKEMPTFTRIFSQEHFWAMRDTGEMKSELRLPLMLAGFRHAIGVLDRELNPAPQGSR